MTTVATIRGFFYIPAGTKPTPCTCGHNVYFIEHRCKPKRKGEEGKLSTLPIAIHGDPRAIAPTDTNWGQGYSHFADCPDAPKHSKTHEAVGV